MTPRRLRIACLQLNAGAGWEDNLKKILRQTDRALGGHADLIALPENFSWRGKPENFFQFAHEVSPRIIRLFREIARESNVAFLLGSILLPSARKNRFYNTSILISEKGRVAAHYHKIHLFDIALKGKVRAKESDCICPGRRVVSGDVRGVRMGLSVCYDVRFPELYRRLAEKGCRLIFVPANFTAVTGAAHWEVLLRARAIENQVYIVAPAQTGVHPVTGIKSFGTSLIVDPWGRVVQRAGRDGEEILLADLDFEAQDRLGREFPVLAHRRIKG